jgi:branched-chain amino acid transport system substrate-binding protein
LVDRHHVVALVANMVPFSVSGFRSAVEAVRVPAIGGESGTSDFFDSPWFFPAGSSAADQALGMVRNGVQAGHPKLGILYCVESSGCTQIFHALQDSAPAVSGAQVVDASPVSLVQTDYTAQCLNARKAGADQLALAMDGASMIRVARSCAAVGYRPLLSAVATQLSAAQSTDATLRSFGLATATPTAPWLLSDSAALAAYNRVLARYAPGVTPDADSMNAWAAVQLLQAAVAGSTDELTSTAVVSGLGRIRQDTLGGLTGPLTFHAGQAHATSSGCVFFETLGPNGWAAPRGRSPVCLPRH